MYFSLSAISSTTWGGGAQGLCWCAMHGDLHTSRPETALHLLGRVKNPKNDDDQALAAAMLCNVVADIPNQDSVVQHDGIPILMNCVGSRTVRADTHYAASCALQNLSCKVLAARRAVVPFGTGGFLCAVGALPLRPSKCAGWSFWVYALV